MDLEHDAVSQRPRQAPPEAIVVGHPVQSRGRDEPVDRPLEVEIKDVLAPDLRTAAKPLAGERHHVSGLVDRKDPACGHELEQSLRDTAGSTPDLEHGRVPSGCLEAG
jgi:hypothetical protein